MEVSCHRTECCRKQRTVINIANSNWRIVGPNTGISVTDEKVLALLPEKHKNDLHVTREIIWMTVLWVSRVLKIPWQHFKANNGWAVELMCLCWEPKTCLLLRINWWQGWNPILFLYVNEPCNWRKRIKISTCHNRPWKTEKQYNTFSFGW